MTAKLSAEELEKLEALAKAATPGPWGAFVSDIDQLTDAGKGYPLAVYPDSKEIVVSNYSEDGPNGVLLDADAAYIAFANPSVLLRLTAQVREAEARIERLRLAIESHAASYPGDLEVNTYRSGQKALARELKRLLPPPPAQREGRE